LLFASLLGSPFNPEYGGSRYLLNISKLLPDYLASSPYATYFVGTETPVLKRKPFQMHSDNFCDHLAEE
jgi:hypothetical protein